MSLIHKLNDYDAKRVIALATATGVSANRFISSAIKHALSVSDSSNAPFIYVVIPSSGTSQESDVFTAFEDARSIAVRHGELLVNDPQCEIVIIDKNREAVLNLFFQNGKRAHQ